MWSATLETYNTLVSSPPSKENSKNMLNMFKEFGLYDDIELKYFRHTDLYDTFLKIKSAVATFPKGSLPSLRKDVKDALWPIFLMGTKHDERLSRLHSQRKLHSLYDAIFYIHLLLIDKIIDRDVRRKTQQIEQQLFQLIKDFNSEHYHVSSDATVLSPDSGDPIELRKTCGGIVGAGSCPPSRSCGSTRCTDIHLMNELNRDNKSKKRERTSDSPKLDVMYKVAKQ